MCLPVKIQKLYPQQLQSLNALSHLHEIKCNRMADHVVSAGASTHKYWLIIGDILKENHPSK